MAKISAAERNRRKRERKKREREEQRKREEAEKNASSEKSKDGNEADDIDIEYVAEAVMMPVPAGVPQEQDSIENVVRRFQERSTVIVTDDDDEKVGPTQVSSQQNFADDDEDSSNSDQEKKALSKRKLRELVRPSVAELKRRVKRPDLVEAHDVTAPDPNFLIEMKSVTGTVVVPRHWGRKRKYLQGKRGFEKPPFQLPDFIVKTGITEVRDSVAEDEANMSAKQKNRGRVAPKMGAMDVDYRTLHDSFFKYQCKPKNLTKRGDLYYEGKELETQTNIKPGAPYSKTLREALGFASESAPPPWLTNMQRYGPPPSYPSLKIPGLNAPLPNDQCQYGYHPGGWGKPPVDAYGRPLYGGNPFDAPGSGNKSDVVDTEMVTSDGKTITKSEWGALPQADFGDDAVEESEEEEESSDEEMEESEEEEAEETPADGQESVLPPPPSFNSSSMPLNLRKQAGDETPMVESAAAPKQLYQVLSQTKASDQSGAVFASDMTYVMPGSSVQMAASVPEGAESVLSKAMPANESAKRKKNLDKDDDADDLGKNFKF